MHTTSRTAAKLIAGAVLLAACEPPTGTPPVVTEPLVRLDSIVGPLTPGAEARVAGMNLSRIPALLLDSVPVTGFRVLDENTAVFRVPVQRGCETDGRPVRIESTTRASIVVQGRLHLPDAVTMRVGESRIMSPAELACLKLPARHEDYAVSVLNLSRQTRMEQLYRFRTYSDAKDTTLEVTVPISPSLSRQLSAAEARPLVNSTEAWRAAGSPAPDARVLAQATLFDPRLATAMPGDTVRLVEWSALIPCGTRRQDVPFYSARVASVVGKAVVLVDLRLETASQWQSSANAGRVDSLASMLDRLTVPTLRALFDAQFEVPGPAGGRHFVVVGRMPFGWAGHTSEFEFRPCETSSGVMISYLAGDTMTLRQRPYVWGNVSFHMHGMQGDMITRLRRGVPGTGSAMDQGWGQNASETAARIAQNAETGAERSARERGETPDVVQWWYGGSGSSSPWAAQEGRPSTHPSFLLFAREQLGQAGLRPSATPVYDRLSRTTSVVESVAQALGVPVDTLLDRFALAAATDDALDPGVAEAAGLPQLRSWSIRYLQRPAPNSSWAIYTTIPVIYREPTGLHRQTAKQVTLTAAGGGYDVWYFPYTLGAKPRGMSVAFTQLNASVPTLVRLTRLR